MIDLLCISIAIGLVVSLLFAETLGKAAGGLVVPGYLALSITRPLDIVLTLAAAAFTYGIVYFASSHLIVYGKRRTAAMILVGFAVGVAIRWGLAQVDPALAATGQSEYTVIGYIIPGLIAIWFDRQGVLDTCSTVVTAAVVVRLLLVVFASSELQQFELENMPLASVAAENAATLEKATTAEQVELSLHQAVDTDSGVNR